ncbi:gamma-glutamyl-gamma-aminobutyrate hydrolase family protein [Nonomuraea ferruginea]
MTRVLVVDNHDSFVHTIVQYLKVLGASYDVRPRDEVRVDDADGYDGVLISPGPGTPEAAGVSVPLVRHAARRGQPLLGVCLGHQAIAHAYGATVARAPPTSCTAAPARSATTARGCSRRCPRPSA